MYFEQLHPGDVVIEGGTHTMMYIGQSGVTQHAMVDAWAAQNGVAIVNFATLEDSRNKGCYVFRRTPTDTQGQQVCARIIERAANYARQWASNQITTRMAPERRVDSPRFHGQGILDNRRLAVTTELTKYVEDREKAEETKRVPAFEYDALYRVLKWVRRGGDQPFSRNRGTTCCAFIIACYQAASLYENTTGDREAKFNLVLENLKNNRNEKRKLGADDLILSPTGKKISLNSMRENSNAGFKGTVGFRPENQQEYMKYLLDELTQKKELTFADVFTPALLIDAKYTNTLILRNRLQSQALSKGWNLIAQKEDIVSR